jgi:hypothetical protein
MAARWMASVRILIPRNSQRRALNLKTGPAGGAPVRMYRLQFAIVSPFAGRRSSYSQALQRVALEMKEEPCRFSVVRRT